MCKGLSGWAYPIQAQNAGTQVHLSKIPKRARMNGLHEHAEVYVATPEVLKLGPVHISDKGCIFACLTPFKYGTI